MPQSQPQKSPIFVLVSYIPSSHTYMHSPSFSKQTSTFNTTPDALRNKYHLAVEITSNRSLKLCSTLSEHLCQIIQIIPSSDTELPHKVLCCTLQITVIFCSFLVFRSAKVSIGRDRSCAFKPLESVLCFGLCVWIECSFAEELIR